MQAEKTKKFVFGIYPGSAVGDEPGLLKGKPDDPKHILKSLYKLQGKKDSFLVRSYLHYIGDGKTGNRTPVNPEQYATDGRKLDLVLMFQTDEEDLTGWKNIIKEVIKKYGSNLGSLQITEEANVQAPYLDGNFKNVRHALVQGIVTAKEEIKRQNLDVKVGFNSTPIFNPADTFWKEINELANESFYDSLDYVGFDFFPDVFQPIKFSALEGAVTYVLKKFREQDLAGAGIPFNIPIRITENGWSTGPNRPYEKQTKTIETVIRTIYALKDELNITHYEFFQLRDADSSESEDNAVNSSEYDDAATLLRQHQFGLLKDDYTPKPAFETYRKLIEELGTK
ncbi:MAG: hypothetical protein ABFD07_16155 [Methanobacterium sp.]